MPTVRFRKSKGQAETPFVFGILIFFTFLAFMTVLIQSSNPEFELMSTFDAAFLGGSLIGVAGTCVVATGLPCAGALIFFSVLQFVVSSNAILSALLFIPLSSTLAYVIARLARGGG